MSASETFVTVAAKLQGRYGAVTDQKPRYSDHVEPDGPQRYCRAADGDEEGRGAGGIRVGGGRRRRPRAAGGHKKSRQQQQPDMVTPPLRRVDAGDDDDDDAGSVCSGTSSASENSTASRGSGSGRTGRRPRGPPRSVRASNSRRAGNGDSSRQSVTVCDCQPDSSHFRSTGASPAADDAPVSGSCCGVERPEPEGGVRTAPYKSAMSDEFDRLIYGPCEPLFSDCEDLLTTETLGDDLDVTKDCTSTISKTRDARASQQQRRRFTGTAANTDSLFSAAQMINTNNMMRFAIIQMELKNVKDISLRRVCCRICNATASALQPLYTAPPVV